MSPSYAAVRFLVVGALAHGCAFFLWRDSLFIVIATLTAGVYWAAGALPYGIQGRVGFALAAAISTFLTMIALVSTQAFTHEEAAGMAVGLTAATGALSLFGGAVGMAVALPSPSRIFTYTVAAFAWGGVTVGVLALVMMNFPAYSIGSVLVLLPLPVIAGGLTAAVMGKLA